MCYELAVAFETLKLCEYGFSADFDVCQKQILSLSHLVSESQSNISERVVSLAKRQYHDEYEPEK